MSRYPRRIVTATPDSAMMQIGEVADRVGLSLWTVGYSKTAAGH